MKKTLHFIVGILIWAWGFQLLHIGEPPKPHEEPKILTEVRTLFDTYFFSQDPTDEKEIDYGIVEGFVEAHWDKNTQFFPPEEAKDFRESITGDFEGIGAYVDKHELGVLIDRLIAGSPGKDAGLMSGDVILSADGTDLVDMDILDAVHYIKGPAGSTVHLEVLRPEEQNILQFDVVRQKIEIPSVEVISSADDNISVIALYAFMENSGVSFSQALQEELAKNPKGLIIDLRDNGGGLLNVAQDILSLFVEPGKALVSIKWKTQEDGEVLYSKWWPDIELPIVVLINENSASASEIVAGALQDYHLATIVGKTSYGKGSVQLSLTLEDSSELKLTTHHWFTPLGRAIEWVGIEPDVEVEYTYEQYTQGVDPQMDTAKQIILWSFE